MTKERDVRFTYDLSEHDLYATAVHEAGHAAIGLALGIPVKHASCKASDGEKGSVTLDYASAQFTPRNHVILAKAGMLAQQTYFPLRAGDYSGWDSDLANIEDDFAKLALPWGYVTREQFRDGLNHEARGLVYEHGDAIQTLANALLNAPGFELDAEGIAEAMHAYQRAPGYAQALAPMAAGKYRGRTQHYFDASQRRPPAAAAADSDDDDDLVELDREIDQTLLKLDKAQAWVRREPSSGVAAFELETLEEKLDRLTRERERMAA